MVLLLCVFACRFFKSDICENADPKTLKKYGFSPPTVCMWVFKSAYIENADPQVHKKMISLQCRFHVDFPTGLG